MSFPVMSPILIQACSGLDMATAWDCDCSAFYLHGFPLSPLLSPSWGCFLHSSTLLSVISRKDLFPCTFSPFLGVLSCAEANTDFFSPLIAGNCRSRQWVQVLAPESSQGFSTTRTSVCWSCSSLPQNLLLCFPFCRRSFAQNNMWSLIFQIFFLGVTKNSYNFMWDLVSTKLGKVQTVLTCHVFHPESKQSLMARGNAWRKVWD